MLGRQNGMRQLHRHYKYNQYHKTTLGGYVLFAFTMNQSEQLIRDDPWPSIASATTRATTNVSDVLNITLKSWFYDDNDTATTWPSTFNDTTSTTLIGSNNMTLSTGEDDAYDKGSKYNWYFLLLLVFVVTGGLGNVLVCLSICLEKKLQNLTNYFLLSLAVADLLVSMVVMPFGISSGLYRREWPFGTALCNAYVTFDVLCCSSSILHMTFISVGRYMGIRNPLKSRNHNSSKKVVLGKVVLVWLFAMLITSPITILGALDHKNIQPHTTVCAINSKFFWIFGSMGAFYLPMVVMVISYVLTVKLLQKQAKFGVMDDQQRARRLMIRRTVTRHGKIALHEENEHHVRGANSSCVRKSTSLHSHNNSRIMLTYDTQIQLSDSNVTTSRTETEVGSAMAIEAGSPSNSSGTPTCSRRSPGSRGKSMRLFTRPVSGGGVRKNSFGSAANSFGGGQSVATEQKASKVLGLVFFSFVTFWAPFFVLNIMFPFVSPRYFSATLIDTCLFLGYISSTINPIIYTVFNKTFRHAFLRLLTCRCRRYAYRHHRRHHHVYGHGRTNKFTAGRNATIVDRLSRSSSGQQQLQRRQITARSTTMSTIMLQSPSSSSSATYISATSGRESTC